MINGSFAKRIDLRDRLMKMTGPPYSALCRSRTEHHQALSQGLIPFTLEVADKAGASRSIEPRYPFFDKRLAEFCLALPGEQKLSDGWTRRVLRQAMSNILPPAIQWRPGKTTLGPNFRHCLLRTDFPLISDFLGKDSEVLEPYVDMPALRKVFCEAKGGNSEKVFAIWAPISLGLWLRHTQLKP